MASVRSILPLLPHPATRADSLDRPAVREFPFIRVDAFNGDPAALNPFTRKAPHFYLLTHAHTDHIAGTPRSSLSYVSSSTAH